MSATLLRKYELVRNQANKRLSEALKCARACLDNPQLINRFESWLGRVDDILNNYSTAQIDYLCQLEVCDASEEKITSEDLNQEEADNMYAEIMEIKRKIFPEPIPSVEKQCASRDGSIPCSQPDQPRHRPNVKLPNIKLPSFAGKLKEFPAFIDLFNSLVHFREELSSVEKFQYLITSLSGEPINVIRAFPISEANYINAYDALTKRYSNKRYLAFICWEEISNTKPLTQGTAHNLRKIVDTFQENISVLNTLGLPTADWDFVLFHCLLTKLDKQSREAFELNNKESEFPKFEDLKSYIIDRCNALERSSLSNAEHTDNSNNSLKRVNPPVQYNKPRPTMLLSQTQNQTCPPVR